MDILILISNFVKRSREKKRLLNQGVSWLAFVCLPVFFLALILGSSNRVGRGRVGYDINDEIAFLLILDFKETSWPAPHAARLSLNYVV